MNIWNIFSGASQPTTPPADFIRIQAEIDQIGEQLPAIKKAKSMEDVNILSEKVDQILEQNRPLFSTNRDLRISAISLKIRLGRYRVAFDDSLEQNIRFLAEIDSSMRHLKKEDATEWETFTENRKITLEKIGKYFSIQAKELYPSLEGVASRYNQSKTPFCTIVFGLLKFAASLRAGERTPSTLIEELKKLNLDLAQEYIVLTNNEEMDANSAIRIIEGHLLTPYRISSALFEIIDIPEEAAQAEFLRSLLPPDLLDREGIDPLRFIDTINQEALHVQKELTNSHSYLDKTQILSKFVFWLIDKNGGLGQTPFEIRSNETISSFVTRAMKTYPPLNSWRVLLRFSPTASELIGPIPFPQNRSLSLISQPSSASASAPAAQNDSQRAPSPLRPSSETIEALSEADRKKIEQLQAQITLSKETRSNLQTALKRLNYIEEDLTRLENFAPILLNQIYFNIQTCAHNLVQMLGDAESRKIVVAILKNSYSYTDDELKYIERSQFVVVSQSTDPMREHLPEWKTAIIQHHLLTIAFHCFNYERIGESTTNTESDFLTKRGARKQIRLAEFSALMNNQWNPYDTYINWTKPRSDELISLISIGHFQRIAENWDATLRSTYALHLLLRASFCPENPGKTDGEITCPSIYLGGITKGDTGEVLIKNLQLAPKILCSRSLNTPILKGYRVNIKTSSS